MRSGHMQPHRWTARASARWATPYRPLYKYFHEPGITEIYGHYDSRFFHALIPYDEHLLTLRHLIQSYLTTLRSLGVDTWLAHGTLLGWWWNGRIMPWDYDLDVQVSSHSLAYLGNRYNRTEHAWRYVDAQTGMELNKTYLLDVNPFHGMRGRGMGLNVIDARWIDMENGMFIDITGLMERDQRGRPGVWSCKNFHRYRTREVWPLRETEFEGVRAKVPYSFDAVLRDEYGMRAMTVTQWEGHRWDEGLKKWVKIELGSQQS
ncbi:LicD family-domain-containing protein [Cercophora newfieldiana]|uniref:LicD family-domain-containing protein n=1 Tax=Cercophora newfieldiana TaxID=92897 RepID=A0AA39XTY4_9PEZI|nr:LicD family-domain-containing protein [Cercophora newfieldiana]